MARRLTILVVVAALCTAAGMVESAKADPPLTPSESLATLGASSPFAPSFTALIRGDDDEATTEESEWYDSFVPVAGGALAGKWYARLLAMRIGAATLPPMAVALGTTGIVIGGAAAGYFGWKLCSHFTGRTHCFFGKSEVGRTGVGTVGAAEPYSGDAVKFDYADWVYHAHWPTGSDGPARVLHIRHSIGQYFGGWTYAGGYKFAADNFDYSSFSPTGATGRTYPAEPFGADGAAYEMAAEIQTGKAAGIAAISGAQNFSATYPCSSTGPATCREYRLDPEKLRTQPGLQLDRGTIVSPEVTYDYTPADGSTDPFSTGTITSIVPGTATGEDICMRAVLNHILSPLSYAAPAGDCLSDPPAEEPEAEMMTLLKPKVNETYTAYLARLEAAGWLGSASSTELAPADETVGANAVSRIRLEDGTVLRTTSWPTAGRQIALGSALELWYNPADAPPAPDPTGDGSGGAVLPDGDPGDCVCPGWDFGPLQDLEYDNSFPFGLFTFAASALAAFDVEPEAPSWSFDLPSGIDGNYDIDLAYFDDYMEIIRTILSVILWIGSVWWFANRILGINVGDNPAEAAADEF